jgi:hypothetical protein
MNEQSQKKTYASTLPIHGLNAYPNRHGAPSTLFVFTHSFTQTAIHEHFNGDSLDLVLTAAVCLAVAWPPRLSPFPWLGTCGSRASFQSTSPELWPPGGYFKTQMLTQEKRCWGHPLNWWDPGGTKLQRAVFILTSQSEGWHLRAERLDRAEETGDQQQHSSVSFTCLWLYPLKWAYTHTEYINALREEWEHIVKTISFSSVFQ